MLFNFLGPHLASGNSNVTRVLAQLSGQFAGNGEATASARGAGFAFRIGSTRRQRSRRIEKYFQGFVNVRDDGALLGPWNPWLREPKFGKPVVCLRFRVQRLLPFLNSFRS
jgi:hypothetical protein